MVGLISKVIGGEDLMQEEEIKKYWGTTLVKVPNNVLKCINLSPQTKVFLQTVGLPVKFEGLWRNFTPDNVYTLKYKNDEYLVISHTSKERLGIKIDSDEVFQLWTNMQDRISFVQFLSSNIETLIVFLQLFLVNYLIISNTTNRDQRKQMIDNLTYKLKTIDPKSMSMGMDCEWVYMLDAWR